MKLQPRFVSILCLSLLLSACCSDIKSAINAYGTTAEEQAIVMKLNFENCLKASDQPSKEAACNAVRNSIEAYRQSAVGLKTIK